MIDNVVITLAPSILIGSSSFLQVTRAAIKSGMSLNFKHNQPQTVELTSLEHHKKSAWTNNGRSVVTTLAPSFLNGSSSFLKVTRTSIKV